MTKNKLAIAGLVATFTLVVASLICLLSGVIQDTGPVYAAAAVHVIYVAVYWHRKIKAGKDGLEFGDDNSAS